jgi:hypothetical protein
MINKKELLRSKRGGAVLSAMAPLEYILKKGLTYLASGTESGAT